MKLQQQVLVTHKHTVSKSIDLDICRVRSKNIYETIELASFSMQRVEGSFGWVGTTTTIVSDFYRKYVAS
jgi:hypothetical protein